MAIALVALVACSSGDGDVAPIESDPGSIDLSWTVGANGCDAAGVDTVAVLEDDIELGSFACSAGSGAVESDPGTFALAVRGRDAGGFDRYGGSVDEVTVTPGQVSSVGSVLLSALPASLTVDWHFANGYLCAQNDVATVAVNLFDPDDYLAQSGSASCDDGTFLLGDVTAGDWTVDVQGSDAVGNVGWEGTQSLTLEKGASDDINVELVSKY